MNNFWYHPYKNLPHWFWTKLQAGGWGNFSGWDIVLVLLLQPLLHPRFDLSKLSGEDIAEALRWQPDLHPHFDLHKLDGRQIAEVLQEQPQLQNLFPQYNV